MVPRRKEHLQHSHRYVSSLISDRHRAEDSVSTLRSALELKAVFDKLQQAEHSGLSPEALRKLEEQAAEQGIRTLWKGAKLEVEAVIRDTAE